jgi:polysaccharide transporter, PST family
MNKLAKKRLIGNITSLSILQIFNYTLPLLLIPYLITVLSAELYGEMILAQALALYFVVIVDYGFTLSATRDIAVNRENKEKLSEIFSLVMTIKLFLLLVSFIVFILIISLFDKFNNYQEIYYISFIAVMGQALFPIWYFQGIEDMKYITIINISCKTFFTILTFIFVQNESDFIYAPLFYSLGFLFAGIWSLYIIYTKYDEKIIKQPIKNLINYFFDSTQYFWSRISSIGYSNTNTFLVGIILPSQYVTYYYLADKIVTVILSIFSPIQQAIYPYLSNKFNNKVFIYSSVLIITSSILIALLILLFDSFISQLLLKELVTSFVSSLNILVYLIPISIIYVMLGAPLLLAKGYIKEFNNSIIYGFITHLFLLMIVYFYSLNFDSTSDSLLILFAYSLIVSKIFVLLLRSYYVYKHNLHKELFI